MDAFKEEQRMLKHWWFMMIPAVFTITVPLLVSKQAQVDGILVAIPIAIIGLVFLLFGLITLHAKIDEQGISIQFKPFMFKVKHIPWKEIAQAKVVKYDPLFEYGGWGYRKGWKKKKIAYNIYGSEGLEIMLHDETKLMLGTQKPVQLNTYLQYLKQKYHLQAIEA